MPDPSYSAQLGTPSGNVSQVEDRPTVGICLALLLVALWPVTHRYKGLGGDAELYAMQALAKIHSNLAGDLFLQNSSQDRYTIFSPLYAAFIRWLGLRAAATTLVVALKIWFFAAAWALARELFDRRVAFLSTAFVMLIAGSYGGYSVFNYSEDWLTARTLAEPIVITSLWLYFREYKKIAVFVAFAAMFVHPLMALPGLILLVALLCPLLVSVACAVLGTLATLGIALYGLHRPPAIGIFSVMDSSWLQVVRERSVFLFPQMWHAGDWEINIQPLISLVLSAIVLLETRLRKLCVAAALVAATGLVIGIISSTIGPVELLLQGQAWRWVWIARFVAVILLAPTLLTLWKDKQCGPLCAALIFLGWTFTPVDGVACLMMALILWSVRRHVMHRGALYFRWTAFVLAGVALAWMVANFWSIVSSPAVESGLEPGLLTKIRNIMGLGGLSIGFAWLLGTWVTATTSRALLTTLSAVLLVCGLLAYPGAFRVSTRDGSAEQLAEFSDWRRAIAPNQTVFVVPAHNSATFAWFTLERPSYLSVDQSAGVVFSRATALEVRRRSDVLLPFTDRDWKLLSAAASTHSGGETQNKRAGVFTRDILISICGDPKLDFVVAKEYLGFEPVTHTHVGNWKNWNLYDCRHVLAQAPPA
jgi:hypothetical protein